MRAAVALIPLLLGLAACQSAADEAEEQYRIVTKAALATSSDRCRAANAVREAYLQEEDARKYRHWTIIASGDCTGA